MIMMVGMPFPGEGKSVFLSQQRDRGDPPGDWEMFCTVQPRCLCSATSSLNAPQNAKGYGRKKALSAAGKALGCWNWAGLAAHPFWR